MNSTTQIEISSLDLTGKNVFIVGKPASGKTFLSNVLREKFRRHIIIHTDDYIGRKYMLVIELESVVNSGDNYILEGNQAYKILSEISYHAIPNIIIDLIVSDDHVLSIYKKERFIGNAHSALKFYRFYNLILEDFISTTTHQIDYIPHVNNYKQLI